MWNDFYIFAIIHVTSSTLGQIHIQVRNPAKVKVKPCVCVLVTHYVKIQTCHSKIEFKKEIFFLK